MRRNQFLYHDPATSRLWVAIWGMIIAFPERERMHALSYALHDDFDRGMQELLAARLSAGQFFVDVGASTGVLTAIGARMVGATGRVLAIEPLPFLCETIRGNVARNAPTTPAEVLQNVVLDRPGAHALDVFEEDSRIGTLFPYADGALPQGSRAAYRTEAVRIDQACADGRPVDFCKIDAEGAELFALRSLEGVLPRSPEIEIVIEWAPAHFARAGYAGADVTAWAERHGFRLAAIHHTTGALEPFDPASPGANILLSRRI